MRLPWLYKRGLIVVGSHTLCRDKPECIWVHGSIAEALRVPVVFAYCSVVNLSQPCCNLKLYLWQMLGKCVRTIGYEFPSVSYRRWIHWCIIEDVCIEKGNKRVDVKQRPVGVPLCSNCAKVCHFGKGTVKIHIPDSFCSLAHTLYQMPLFILWDVYIILLPLIPF